jgi:hypothetical protein
MDEFWSVLATLGACIVILGFISCLVLGGRLIYRQGIKSRCDLEKRGGLFKSVDDYRKKEDAELDSLSKRRSELGRND